MKKLLTVLCALALSASLALAQAGGASTGSTSGSTGTTAGSTDTTAGKKHHKGHHKGGKKHKKGGADTTTTPPK